MPQAVAPWTWRRVLRDEGPDDPGFLLAMLILATYMDSEGYAFPGQPTWARGARKSVRMLQRYIARARREGWLSVVNARRGGKGWAFNAYRCCVPDSITLDEKDQEIGDALCAQAGEIEAADTAMSPPQGNGVNGHDTMMSPATPATFHGDDIPGAMVTTSRAHGDDIVDHILPTSGCRTKSASENSRSITHATEEARRKPSAIGGTIEKATEGKSPEPDRSDAKAAIRVLLKHGMGDTEIARMLHRRGVTAEDVRAERAVTSTASEKSVGPRHG